MKTFGLIVKTTASKAKAGLGFLSGKRDRLRPQLSNRKEGTRIMAETTRKSHLHHDLTAPDSLITQRQYEDRQARLDKFQRRAANPNAAKDRCHRDRLRLIDELVNMKTDPLMIDCMIAAWIRTTGSPADREKIKTALSILNGEATTEPPPEPDMELVDDYIGYLSQKSDPFEENWSEEDRCYYIAPSKGIPVAGVNVGDSLALKHKTPEPGDLALYPDSEGRFYTGYYVRSDREHAILQTEKGLRRGRGSDARPLANPHNRNYYSRIMTDHYCQKCAAYNGKTYTKKWRRKALTEGIVILAVIFILALGVLRLIQWCI
jgi:hypothetical protein